MHLDFEYVNPETGETLEEAKGKTHPLVGSTIPEGPLTCGFDYYHGFHHAGNMIAIIEDDTAVIAHDPEINMLPRLAREAVEYIDDRARVDADKPFFLHVPSGSPHTPILPTAEWQGKSGLGAYADFVMETDAAFGGIVEALERNGFSENTIVIFSCDQ